MVYKNREVVLLLSKDQEVKQSFRKILNSSKYQNVDLTIQRNLKGDFDKNYLKIIFIDIDSLDSNSTEKILKHLKKVCILAPVFIISCKNNLPAYPIEKLLNYRVGFVFKKPLEEIVLKSIFYKNLNFLKDRSFEFKKHKKLLLNEKFRYLIYKDCKIFLSKTECCLISILIDEYHPVEISRLKKLLEERLGKELSKGYVRICIYRIRKKFKRSLGFYIIKNRYGVGYYLSA